jgi:predicted transposase YbfD/YdcC
MKLKPKITLMEHFSDLEDPRIERTKLHKLIDIVTIAVCAVICGADSWVEIEIYGKSKHEWLKQFLELPNGIPSHDTIARVFANLNPEQFQKCFRTWIESISKVTEGEVIAVDGKTLRHSYDKGAEKGAIHMVSAWATSQKLVLGQVKVNQKSNEITAIPELIKVLSLNGCIVTIDAMGCQREIVKTIVEQGGDYVITLKKNQGSLYERVEELFKNAVMTRYQGFTHSDYRYRDSGHDRKEIRYYSVLNHIKEQVDIEDKWLNLTSVGKVDYVRTVDGVTKMETRYFISSLAHDAVAFGQYVRSKSGNRKFITLDIRCSI